MRIRHAAWRAVRTPPVALHARERSHVMAKHFFGSLSNVNAPSTAAAATPGAPVELSNLPPKENGPAYPFRIDNVNWFPGHMYSAMQGLQSKLKDTHTVVEVRDARVRTFLFAADLFGV